MAEEERNPIDQLVDLFVYAPVGLLYEYDEVIPRLVKLATAATTPTTINARTMNDKISVSPITAMSASSSDA